MDVATGRQITAASSLANYNDDIPCDDGAAAGAAAASAGPSSRWFTQTCTLGWAVQGIWSPSAGGGMGMGMDGSDINAADRNASGKLLVTSDDFGSVNLYRFPCVQQTAKCAKYSGHSSHVTCVRWTAGDSVVSAGGNDKCIFVWTLTE